MEEKESPPSISVINLVGVFENFSPLRSPGKKHGTPQARPHLRAPNPMVSHMFPSISDRRTMMEAEKVAHIQHSQMPGSAESTNDLAQAHRGLTVKCLGSLRGKITTSDWRTQQSTDSESSNKMLSGVSRSQVIEKVHNCYSPSANNYYIGRCCPNIHAEEGGSSYTSIVSCSSKNGCCAASTVAAASCAPPDSCWWYGRIPRGKGMLIPFEDPDEKKIALELLETEKAYVSRLHLLDQVFFSELMKEAKGGKTIPEDVVKMIFSNISSIYQFHAQFFLPELQKRMESWDSNPRIGDIIQKLAPFLKMYSEYVKNFDKAVELITTWSEKCLPFQELISSIQRREISANLTLQHHMLEPVQRIPRYELLLKDYIRKLPPKSLDREDAQKALEIIFTAAKHSNAAIAEMERLQNLWEVYHRLGLEDDIIDPSNELMKEGPIQKISFRHNNTTEKYLFLFNNLLLYCVPKVIQVGAEFQVHSRIDVEGMKVRELNDAEFPYAFLVSGKQRTLELQARSQEEMNAWIKAFQSAINKKEKRNESFRAAIQGPEAETQDFSQCHPEELGKRAPQWVRDKLVTMCMRCKDPFNAFRRRRHHCRACGYVVCGRCSEYKVELQYDKNGPKRVCGECYVFLTGHLLQDERHGKHKGILEKESAELSGQSLMCSFLQLLDKSGKGGMRGWFVLPRDDPLVLYIYAAPQDVKAHTSIPLLGYQVKDMPQSDNRHIFQLVQSKQVYTLVAETDKLKQQWMKAIAQSARGEEEEEDSFDELE